MKVFDVENWKRKDHYEFFKDFEDPFFNIMATLDVTNLYNFCKKHQLSFSLACVYVTLKSTNEIPAFKLRLKNGKVYQYDFVDIGSTILNDDETFSFCDFPYQKTIFEFDTQGKKLVKAIKEGVHLGTVEDELAIIHCTTIPWVSITGFKHARRGDEKNKGIPKIVFGGMFSEENIKKIPFSVDVHHALMDGLHVSKLFNKMQRYINELV
jgi:chloramphenicol O-acetyltransferase type A